MKTEHPDTEWQQVSGDVGAAEYGALFGRWENGWYNLTEIQFMPHLAPDWRGTDPYYVWEASYKPGDVKPEAILSAKKSWGMPPDTQWTFELLAEALFQYGYEVDAEQDLRVGPGDGYETLALAMDAHDIPAAALWDPEQYSLPNPDADEEEEDTEESE